jgi:hypothetical protein
MAEYSHIYLYIPKSILHQNVIHIQFLAIP